MLIIVDEQGFVKKKANVKNIWYFCQKKVEKKMLTYVRGGDIIIKSPREMSDTKASQTQINTELESNEL